MCNSASLSDAIQKFRKVVDNMRGWALMIFYFQGSVEIGRVFLQIPANTG